MNFFLVIFIVEKEIEIYVIIFEPYPNELLRYDKICEDLCDEIGKRKARNLFGYDLNTINHHDGFVAPSISVATAFPIANL